MKLFLLYYLLIALAIFSCIQAREKDQSMVVDIKVADTAKNKINLLSDDHNSYFETKVWAQYYTNDFITDSVNDDNYGMSSWYSIRNDTIELVVHVSDFVTNALLLRILHDSTIVRLFLAPHTLRPMFKLNPKDTFADFVEVPPRRYQLQLSEKPDAKTRRVIYGYIDMESSDYFVKEGATEIKESAKMKFYFRSQYKQW